MVRLMKPFFAIALLLSVSGCNSSRGTENASRNPTDAEPNRAVQQSGASTFSSSSGNADCGLSLDSVNTKFTLALVSSRSAPTRHVLVKEEVRQQGCTNSEGMKGTVDLWGWVDQFEAGIASTWQAHTEGHEGEIDGAFYRVT